MMPMGNRCLERYYRYCRLCGERTLSSRDNVYYGMMEGIVSKPELWNSEHPYLYTLVLKLTDNKGNVVDARSSKVGFRDIKNKRQSDSGE